MAAPTRSAPAIPRGLGLAGCVDMSPRPRSRSRSKSMLRAEPPLRDYRKLYPAPATAVKQAARRPIRNAPTHITVLAKHAYGGHVVASVTVPSDAPVRELHERLSRATGGIDEVVSVRGLPLRPPERFRAELGVWLAGFRDREEVLVIPSRPASQRRALRQQQQQQQRPLRRDLEARPQAAPASKTDSRARGGAAADKDDALSSASEEETMDFAEWLKTKDPPAPYSPATSYGSPSTPSFEDGSSSTPSFDDYSSSSCSDDEEEEMIGGEAAAIAHSGDSASRGA